MKSFPKRLIPFLFLTLAICIQAVNVTGTKSIYIPSSFGNMDLNNTTSQWCYSRSVQSEDFIVFWEAGYGANPKTTTNTNYRVDVDALLNIAETGFRMYRDSLKFITVGNSKTDSYKMIILLFYSTTWQASGSGVDNMIGLLNLSANGAQALGVTVAHEVGHCFQYQVHCDGFSGGWMYGFGANGSGGNCWWEQCAQWQAFKVLPDEQFSNYQFPNYLGTAHKNILHETPRYANYFIQDYWTYLHGMDFIGRLWRDSKYPEDPVDAYKRITQVSQSQFNDEIYDCASRFVTWDIPALRERGKGYIDARESSPMKLTADSNYWMIDSSKCIENYGYNTVRLNVPDQGTPIKIHFEGKAGASGFRSVYKGYAGWRYGVVALTEDGKRFYSPVRSASYASPVDSLSFDCPDKCSRLWLVVTGAPALHWHHAWDDNDANDEQWPWQVKFENTNLYGIYKFSPDNVPANVTLTQDLTLAPVTVNTNPYPSTAIQPNWEGVCKAFCLNLQDIKAAYGSTIKYCAVNPNGGLNYTSTANAPGHWFNKTGYTTNWGNSSYVFSEFKQSSLTFNIGQYPNLCKNGDKITIRQALVYTPATGSPVKATFVFNISIATPTALQNIESDKLSALVKNTIVTDYLNLNVFCDKVIVRNLSGVIVKTGSNTNAVCLGNLAPGIYLVTAGNKTEKIIKTNN